MRNAELAPLEMRYEEGFAPNNERVCIDIGDWIILINL
jgi:hypothetical protein